MTQPPENTELAVTQEDRDAARSILWVETLIDDEEAIVQAFARHRLASLSSPVLPGVREAVVMDLRLARANWRKYETVENDEQTYQANKMATAIDACLAALLPSKTPNHG